MAKNIINNNGNLGLVVIAIVIGALVYATFLAPSSKSVSNPANPASALANCPTGLNQVLNMYLTYQDFTATPVTTTQVATSYSVYDPTYANGQVAVLSGTTSATAANAFPLSGSAGCYRTYKVVGGDNGVYYENIGTTNTTTNVTTVVSIPLYKYSAPTLQATNSPTTAYGTNAIVAALSTGAQSITAPLLTIQAGTNYFGTPTTGGGFLVIFSYNNLAISGVNIAGATPYTGTLPASSFVTSNSAIPRLASLGSQNTQQGYIFPSCHYSQYCTPSGAVGGFASFNPIIQTLSNFAANEVVSVSVIPLTNYYSASGQWVQNTAVNAQGANILPSTSSTYAIQLDRT